MWETRINCIFKTNDAGIHTIETSSFLIWSYKYFFLFLFLIDLISLLGVYAKAYG